MQAGAKSGLTKALEELTTLLPKALECCSGAEPSQNSPIVEKLRSVLLELIQGCLTCNAGKHIVAVLRILQLVLEKLPATFAEGAHRAALVHMVMLLTKLPEHQEVVGEQLLVVLCSLSDMLAEQDTPLLQQLLAGTVDLLLDLEQVLFALSTAAAEGQQVASVQLSLYPALLHDVKQQQATAGAAGWLPGHSANAAEHTAAVKIQDAKTWETFVQLALRLLLHQLQECPTVLGCCTPAAVLVPALGQMMTYSSAKLQELCLGLMALLVLQQPQQADMVPAAANYSLWMLQCAGEGQLPAESLCLGSMQALTACVSACTAALHGLGLLGLFCDRLLHTAGKALLHPATQPYAPHWLSLMQQALSLNPQHAGTAALVLPLRTAICTHDAPAAADAGGQTSVGAASIQALLEPWRQVAQWMAAADTRDAIQQQLLSLQPWLQAPSRQQQRSQTSGDVSGSPVKNKKRRKPGPEGPQKKYKQMQFTVLEGGFVSSQRPGKGSGGSSSQPTDTTPAGAAAGPAATTAQSAAQAALYAMHQLQELRPAAPAAAAAARLAALLASLAPDANIPAELLPALGLRSTLPSPAVDPPTTPVGPLADALRNAALSPAPAGAAVAAAEGGCAVDTTAQLEMLILLLQGLSNGPQQCPALVASLSQQVVACVNQSAGDAEALPLLLQALLLALVATVSSIAAEPRGVDMHVRVWQHAQDSLQGLNNIFNSSSNSSSAAPPGLWAAAAVSWLAATRLMGWSGSSALNNATSQLQHACSSSIDGSSSRAAGVLLLPVVSVLQHMQYSDGQGAFLPPGAAAAGAGGRPKAAAGAAADQDEAMLLGSQQQEVQAAVLDTFMQGFEAATAATGAAAAGAGSTSASAVQMAALVATSQLLQLQATGTTAGGLAALLQDAAQRVMSLCCDGALPGPGSNTVAGSCGVLDALGPFSAPCLVTHQPEQCGSASSSKSDGAAVGVYVRFPPLQQLLPVLEAALQAADQPELQAAAVHLLSSYLHVVSTPTLLYGTQEALLDALALLTARDGRVRDAALGLVQQYLQQHVLVAVCGGEQTAEEAVAAATQAAAEFQEAAVAVATQPQRRLLRHLQNLLAGCEARAGGAGAEGIVAAKTALMRAMAGLFSGLHGSGCEDIPLLQLLQQINDDNAQVSAVALELLQHLAAAHAVSKELDELLLEGPAATALLTAVGRSLHTQPSLFHTLAELCKLDDGQLAEAVAPYTVQWLCQHQLKEPLQMLASKLGQAPSTLLLGAADAVIAHMLWFSLDSLESFTRFVEAVMHPETFIAVVTVCGRKIVRRVVQLAGLPCFWDSQYQPPPKLLACAQEYVGILASIMELPQPAGTIELLQGEPIALLLKSIGNALSKSEPAGTAQQQQQQQEQQQGQQQRKGQASKESLLLSGVAAEKLQSLRALVVLMNLLGDQVGTYALQLMAVLSESLIYCTHGPLKMQALSAWLCFVQLLARHAPQVLERIAAQAAVVLLPVLEPADSQGNPSAATAGRAAGGNDQKEVDTAAVQLAAQVLHAIVVQHRSLVRAALQNMPPLPSLAVLKEVNAVLIQEQGRQSPMQQLQLLMASLRHESIAVRHVALGEVRSFLLTQKTFISDTLSGLVSCSTRPALHGPNKQQSAAVAAKAAAGGGKGGSSGDLKLLPVQCQDLLSELLAALMASCENLGRDGLAASMKQRCAQCLGLLGAIDPSRVQPELPRPSAFKYDAQHFLSCLVQEHLVRVLQTASDISQLEMTSYALQQILQHFTAKRMKATSTVMLGTCSVVEAQRAAAVKAAREAGDSQGQDPAAAGGLYSLLDAHNQSIVAPFLTTRFTQIATKSEGTGVVFGSHHHTFRRWLYLWLKQLAAHATGPLAAAFEACRGVTYWDQPLMLYLLPFMMVEAAGQGGAALQMVTQEIHAVMQCAASGQNAQDPSVFINDIELYLQCIFTQLDLLQQWVQKQQEICDKAAEQAAQQQQQQAAQQKGGASSRSNNSSNTPEVQLAPFVANVAELVSTIPIQIMAQAALKCGAYARALQYFEIFVRQQHGGGLNPAAYGGGCSSYDYDEVSFLLEVYGHLEEPDGIAGLAQLRQGGLTSTDQILVAEKAGAWTEALALYEQALSQEATAAAAASSSTAAGGAASAAGVKAEEGQAAPRRLGAAAADVLISAACAVVSGLPAAGTTAQGSTQHRLSTWMGLEQLQPAANVAGHAAVAGAEAAAAVEGTGGLLDASQACVSSLQVGHLRCLLQMGHQRTLLRQVDGLMARSLGQASAAAAAVAITPAAVAGQAVAAAASGEGADGALQAVQWSLGQLAALGVAAAWRLGAWDQLRGYLSVLEAAGNSPAGLRPLSAGDRWECCMGAILEAAQRGSHKEVMSGLYNARAGVLSLLPAIAGESYSRAYPDLLKLHMLQELEDAWTMQRASPAGTSRHQRTKGLRWSGRLDIVSPLLSSCEPLLALRRQLSGLMNDADGMGRCWLQHAKLCRATGHQEAAETSVIEAQARSVPGALLERCRLLWARDKGHRAMLELQLALQQQLEGSAPTSDSGQHQHAKEMLQLTEWMAAVGQGDKEMLCENYRESILLDTNWEKAHFAFGRYLDQLYTDAKQREGKPAQPKGQDRLGGRSRIKVEEDNPYQYLSEALKHYGESVRLGHKNILQSLPRLLTLYFEFGSKVAATKAINQKIRTAQTQVNGVMQSLIRSIPTYKWLLVLPQLTSRMCHVQADVQDFMQQLLTAIVEQYPHQALWSMAVVVKSTIRARQESATAVLQAAKRRSSETNRRLFENFQRLTDQLIKTCMWQPPSDRRTNRCSAQKEFSRLWTMLPMDIMMPVQTLFTVDLPPGKLPPGHRPVSSQTFIHGLRDEVLIMNSLMKPKKITFVGSDGLDYPFLAKPRDDLRKDYRLMDFAGTTNALLARTPGARRRGLALRTYAVLPLTDDCGILQWLNNLVPFKAACEDIYIKEKMWKRHKTPMQIKVMYDNFAGQHHAQKLDQVLKLLPPRMSKWMLAKFTDPGTWLAARLAFTRTNAAWAMVGHVLGLGDRHGENILIDGLTGETVHVDFGCLFDRGLTLEVPERVPFRMTQNVIDCFGVSGVEGTFRRAAEMTLQVLRDNRPTLMTCAETFLHDPLVDWTSGKRTTGSSGQLGGLEAENPQAKDALHVMDGRLSGTLLGVLSTPSLPLSCEGQAARLIDEATDHENLGRMYIWWMPWM